MVGWTRHRHHPHPRPRIVLVLLVALGREGHVDPTGEFVLEIPPQFAVPDKEEGVLLGRLEGGKPGCAGTNSHAGASGIEEGGTDGDGKNCTDSCPHVVAFYCAWIEASRWRWGCEQESKESTQ